MKYLVTGGCGFLGSNIAAEIIRNSLGELVVFDNLSRPGSQENLVWLKSLGNFSFVHGDIRNQDDVDALVRDSVPEGVMHLCGQVAMTTSIQNPRHDFEVNALGTFNLLDSVKKYSPSASVIYSSTNKVYGDLEWTPYRESATRYESIEYPRGFDETIPLDFRSPYGCSKGSADQMVLDAYSTFGLKTAVFRHSSMFGGRQFSTADQGWIGWFCQKAIEQRHGELKPFTISGNGKQVRDVLFAQDMVALYLLAMQNIQKIQGQAFNIGGGIENSLSLLELFDFLGKELGVTLKFDQLQPRQSDQKVFVADIAKVSNTLGWKPLVDRTSGLEQMLSWVNGMRGQ